MTQEIPTEYQAEIADLAKATANRLAKLGNRPSPRKRKAIIDQAAREVMQISMRIVFDRMARVILEGFATPGKSPVGMIGKTYSGAAPLPGGPFHPQGSALEANAKAVAAMKDIARQAQELVDEHGPVIPGEEPGITITIHNNPLKGPPHG